MTPVEAPAGSNPAGAHPGPYPDHPKETHMTMPIPDPRAGGLAALHLIETGPAAVRCTRCGADDGQPCRDVTTGRHHRERLWMIRDQVITTLRHALDLPLYGPVPALTTPKES